MHLLHRYMSQGIPKKKVHRSNAECRLSPKTHNAKGKCSLKDVRSVSNTKIIMRRHAKFETPLKAQSNPHY
jgi:hypothetical protein